MYKHCSSFPTRLSAAPHGNFISCSESLGLPAFPRVPHTSPTGPRGRQTPRLGAAEENASSTQAASPRWGQTNAPPKSRQVETRNRLISRFPVQLDEIFFLRLFRVRGWEILDISYITKACACASSGRCSEGGPGAHHVRHFKDRRRVGNTW